VSTKAKTPIADNAQILLLAADCQIRRQPAGSGDPARANCDVLSIDIFLIR
jgi:hypothetical protein